ncbi:MAG: hypothetical protein KBC64_02235 [Simkaniaceae bacterium]|nr:hypothetical protein [Simkaniaceae bacterium]
MGLTLGDLCRYAQVNKTCQAAVSQIWTILLIKITPSLERHTSWLHTPEVILDKSGEISSPHKIQALAISVLKHGFDINPLPVTKEAFVDILDREPLQISQNLIALYSRIWTMSLPPLIGTPMEQAHQIRVWMESNRTSLATIITLDLSNLGLSDIPPELTIYFPSLQDLSLRKNRFTTVPDLSKLARLRTLNLSHNQLTVVPDLPALTSFDYRNNPFILKTNISSLFDFPSSHRFVLPPSEGGRHTETS